MADSRISASTAFLDHLRPVGWGVLGLQSTRKGGEVRRAPEPGAGTAIVDPAGLVHIREAGPSGAQGASGSLYSFLRIQDFPSDVVREIKKVSDAKGHSYGDVFVIHAIGPDFRKEPFLSGNVEVAEKSLRLVYTNVLREFAKSGLQKLRLLPMSGGTYCGPYEAELPDLTARMLASAFSRLAKPEKDMILAASVELCIFSENDLVRYSEAMERAKMELQRPNPPANEPQSRAGEGAGGDQPNQPGRHSRRQNNKDSQLAAPVAEGDSSPDEPRRSRRQKKKEVQRRVLDAEANGQGECCGNELEEAAGADNGLEVAACEAEADLETEDAAEIEPAGAADDAEQSKPKSHSAMKKEKRQQKQRLREQLGGAAGRG